MFKKILFTCFFLCFIFYSYSQSHTISGKVLDEKGQPVSGASIVIKGKESKGVSASSNGNFSIEANVGDVLVVTALNSQSQEVRIGSKNSVSVTMQSSGQNLSEVVVTTALGIKRRADVLSYSTQGIKSDKLSTTRITDVNNALAGKIAGVQVRSQSGAKLGSASTVRLRGEGGINDLSPLYIVDGTPVDAQDVNPDDVDDIQVLKGPAAAALYGQRGESGVIMITTKKGNKRPGIGVDVTSTATIEKVGLLPQYQNDYAGGTFGTPGQEWKKYTWDASMPAEWKALDGKYYHTYFDDASWGPRIAGQEYIPWYAWYPGTKYSNKTAILTPQPNNIKDFWNKNGAGSLINTVSLSKAGDNFNFKMSYTNVNQKGLLPNTDYKKHYLSTGVSYDLNEHLTAAMNFNYVSDFLNGEFDDGYGNQSGGSFSQWFHRDLDMSIMKELRGYRTPDGVLPTWNLNDANGINGVNSLSTKSFLRPNYWFNHYSYFDEISSVTKRNRVFGDVSLSYKFSSHFKITGFIRRNQSNLYNEGKVPSALEFSNDAQSTVSYNENNPASASTARPIRATYSTKYRNGIENNYEFLASYNQKFGDFLVDLNAGANDRKNDTTYIYNTTKGGLIIPDLFTLSNSKSQPFYYENSRKKKEVISLYARAGMNWKDIVIFDFSVRNDVSSALPTGNNSYVYPSAGTSFIFTKFIQKSLPVLTFGKIRASYAQIGSDLDPYLTRLNYGLNAAQWNSNLLTSVPNRKIDENIKPSLSSSYELGMDLRFLKNRIGLNFTYYEQHNKNQIISAPISSVSGFTSTLINAGRIDRKGIEISLDGRPIVTKNFQWDISINLAKNKSTIVDLYPGVNTLYSTGSDFTSSTGNPSNAPGVWNTVGQPWGQLFGTGILKNNGVPVLNPDGTYVAQNNVNFGSVLPDYTGGVVNSFKYKDFNLSIVIDFCKGGKYFSLSDFYGKGSGLYTSTTGINDKGNPMRDPVADGGGIHVVGVDTSTKHELIDTYIEAGKYFAQFSNSHINENSIFDLDYVKVRELSLGYRLPIKKLGKIGKTFQYISLTALVRNPLLIYTKNPDIDPSEIVGAYGESGQLPPTKSYGLTLKFGF